MSVLNCVYDSISQILRKNVERKSLFDNLDVVMLAIDEICDGGILLEADPTAVAARVAIRTDDIPLGEQTVAQVPNKTLFFGATKNVQIKKSLSSNFRPKLTKSNHFVQSYGLYALGLRRAVRTTLSPF